MSGMSGTQAPADLAQEAAHQDALMHALFRRSDALVSAARPLEQGLAAYRNNASANAQRAMALMFPAVFALLGEDDFAPLVRLHWLAQPPLRGDWSQYGAAFGAWIARENPGGIADALPFLPNLAQLDDALTRCQDAADATLDWSTLALLEQAPDQLRIVLHPSTALLRLDYAVLPLRHAVLNAAPFDQPAQNPNVLLINRIGYRAQANAINSASAGFVSHCLAGATVLQAHAAATGIDPGFDVSAWLSEAITTQLIVRVEILDRP